jgi:type IV fimbrial biogenesis protein FimT
MGAHRHRGLTLLEMMVALAILAVLATLAVPSMGSQLDRHRLVGAAEALAIDLAEARFEAARRGQPLHVQTQADGASCWAVATAPGCDCSVLQSCQLKRVGPDEHRGVQVTAGGSVRFAVDGRPDRALGTELRSRAGRLRVELGLAGRARVCDPEGRFERIPRC